MQALLANPESLIASAIAEGKKWNVTGYNVDMEAPSPLGCNALPVIAFVNKLSAALAEEGIQTSYCIGSMNGDAPLAQALNKTAMRTVPMGLCVLRPSFRTPQQSHNLVHADAVVVYRPHTIR